MATLLVVESPAPAESPLVARLRGDGHTVIAAHSLAQAHRQLAHGPAPDGAIVEERLPDGDGVAFMADLRMRHPRCARVLVGDQRLLSAMVRAVNISNPHQVVRRDAPTERKCGAIDSALLVARSAADAATSPAPELGREHLHRLFASDDFQLALQPIISAHGTIFGYEGLIRTADPSFSTPAQVLYLAERHDMLDHLLYAVAERARTRLDQLVPGQRLFLNLHPEDLADPDELVRLLRPIRSEAHRVALEITGRAHTRWASTLSDRLAPLRRAGFSVGIDDLGAGEGALMLLAEATPSFIKAHDSIIRGVVDSPHKLRILEMVCHFAGGSRAQVIAEGVEREEEARVLRTVGIPLFQGFLFGAPSVDPSVYTQPRLHVS